MTHSGPFDRAFEHRLRAAVESAPSGLLMTDQNGGIVLVNRQVELMFGYPREELLGRPVHILVPQRLRARHPEYREGFMADPRVRAMGAGRDLYGVRKDGTEVPVEIGLTPVPTPEGMFVLAAIVDITARKTAEAENQRLERDLRQAQKMEALGTLAGGIAHDFNNVLATIIGYAELIAAAKSTDRIAADARELLNAASRGKAIVEQILAFSRRQEPTLRPLALETALESAGRLLRPSLPATIDLRIAALPGAPRILGDANAIQQIVMNLCANAVQAMPRGGRLELALEPFYVRDSVARGRPDLREGSYTILSVRDEGTGMDAATRERVFEPFFTTKPPGEGTGLGMSIVHSIIKHHQGVVEIESEPGRGTTVRCFFPGIEAAIEEPPVEVDDVPRGHGEHILLVEDNAMLAEVGERRVSALGYRVTTVTDPRAALEQFRVRPGTFDLVLTDFLMPGMNGLEFATQVSAARPGVPIVLQTGYMDTMPEETVTAAGIRRVVQKPATLAQLAQALAEVIAERRAGGG